MAPLARIESVPTATPTAPSARAREEIPAGRTCRVKLYDDGTFRAIIYHSDGGGDWHGIVYEPATSQILRVHRQNHSIETDEFALETLYTPTWEETDVEELETVEPPYR